MNAGGKIARAELKPVLILIAAMTLSGLPVASGVWAAEKKPADKNGILKKNAEKNTEVCAADWKKFWQFFAANPEQQKFYTAEPLHRVELNGEFLSSHLYTHQALAFPVLPGPNARIKQKLRLKQESIGREMGRLTLFPAKEASQTIVYYFRLQDGCWQLYRVEDLLTVHKEKQDPDWLANLFPNVQHCVPGFYFSDRQIESIKDFFKAKGYQPVSPSDDFSVEFDLKENFFGYPAVKFTAFVPEESVYVVEISAPAEKVAETIAQHGKGKIEIFEKENPEGSSNLAYLIDQGPQETLFVCPVDIGL